MNDLNMSVMKNYITIFNKVINPIWVIAVVGFIASCELRPELPEEGSIPDLTPPSASFEFIPTAEDFRVIQFTNTSSESIKYVWDFGGDAVVCEEVDGVLECGTSTTSTSENPLAKVRGGRGVL